jgi:very-short-patch-repair endonuclease
MGRRPVVPPELTRGPFTVIDAQRAGLTWKQLQGASWRRVGAGLYVWAGLGDEPVVVLAGVCRRLPPGAAFSGTTAAWLHGLDLPPCEPIEVTIPGACRVSALAGVSVRRAGLGDVEVVERRGLPTTSAHRTVIDLGRQPSLVDAVVSVDMALHQRLVDLQVLRAFLVAHPRGKGVGRLRRVLDLAEPAAESAMETRLRLLLVLAGLPRPKAQVSLHDDRGRFLGRPDLYYPDQRLGLEYDGSTHRDSLIQDNRRQNRLLTAGYRLLRFTAADVRHNPDGIVQQVRDSLKGRSAGESPLFRATNGRFAGESP